MSLIRIAPLLMSLFAGLMPPHAAAQTAGRAGDIVQNEEAVQVSDLSRLLMIEDVVDIMRLEGIEYGADMEGEMFPGKGGASWQSIVTLIYDPVTMRKRFDDAFAREIAGDDAAVAKIRDYFDTDLGQRILMLEVEARRSLMDEAVEDAAKARVEDMMAEDDPRMGALQRFADINDLVEANVAGALNANLAFFQGMAEVGALGEDMTEDQMLSDVWSQEPDIRAETEDWLFPYLALAYGPLSDEEIQSYIDFSETPAGAKLNRALFAAFDAVFAAISRDLGRAAARQMMGEDI